MLPRRVLSLGLVASAGYALLRGCQAPPKARFSGPMPAPYHPKQNGNAKGFRMEDCPVPFEIHTAARKHMEEDLGLGRRKATPEAEDAWLHRKAGSMQELEDRMMTDFATEHFRSLGNLDAFADCYDYAFSSYLDIGSVPEAEGDWKIKLLEHLPLRHPVGTVPRSPAQDFAIRHFEHFLDQEDPTGERRRRYEFGGTLAVTGEGKPFFSEMKAGSERRVDLMASSSPAYVLEIHNHPHSLPGSRNASPSPHDFMEKRARDQRIEKSGLANQTEPSILLLEEGVKIQYGGSVPFRFSQLTEEVSAEKRPPVDMY